MLRFVVCLLLLEGCLSLKMFMFGGGLVDDNNEAYKQIGVEIGKPTKLNCDQNWDTTECPKVAVFTSGSPDTHSAISEYSKGVDGQIAPEKFFKDMGMAPKHFSVQIDNYKTASNIFDFEGYQYYFDVYDIDVVYFNGGDQARHIRCWLNDDGMPNPLFSQVRRKVNNNEAVVVAAGESVASLAKMMFDSGSSYGLMYFASNAGLPLNAISSGNLLRDTRNGTDCLLWR